MGRSRIEAQESRALRVARSTTRSSFSRGVERREIHVGVPRKLERQPGQAAWGTGLFKRWTPIDADDFFDRARNEALDFRGAAPSNVSRLVSVG